MIRTRDFALFLSVVFLLIANIAVATVRSSTSSIGQGALVLGADPSTIPEVGERAAQIPEAPGTDHASRLAVMREKVAARLGLEASIRPRAEAPPPLEEPAQAKLGENAETPAALLTCAGYAVVSWPSFPGAAFKEVEGARIVYRAEPPAATRATATAASNEVVLAQLPLRTSPLPSPACIPQDVIGIAIDGSLIRNNETGLYSVFEENTLVGYALDGFPIYGLSNTTTDRCGGTVVNGWYRYYLSSERENIIDCFASVPISL